MAARTSVDTDTSGETYPTGYRRRMPSFEDLQLRREEERVRELSSGTYIGVALPGRVLGQVECCDCENHHKATCNFSYTHASGLRPYTTYLRMTGQRIQPYHEKGSWNELLLTSHNKDVICDQRAPIAVSQCTPAPPYTATAYHERRARPQTREILTPMTLFNRYRHIPSMPC